MRIELMLASEARRHLDAGVHKVSAGQSVTESEIAYPATLKFDVKLRVKQMRVL